MPAERPPNPHNIPLTEPIHPDLKAYFFQTFDEEEYLEDVRRMKAEGPGNIDGLIEELTRRLAEHEQRGRATAPFSGRCRCGFACSRRSGW